jgi:diguanylate cyclase (GGDEF)-like protein
MDDPRELSILIADPDKAYCAALKHAFDEYGHSVTIAADGTDLLARFTPNEFDVVIAGVNLRRPNGLDILRHFKKHNPATPVYLLCDNTSVDFAKLGIKEGAIAYFLTDSDDWDHVVNTIEQYFEFDNTPAEVESEETSELEPSAPAQSAIDTLAMSLMREMIQAASTRPLIETMRLLAFTCAQIMQAKHGVVLLAQPGGLQIVTPLDDIPLAVKDFLARQNDGFAYRVGSARKTLIDAMPGDADNSPMQFIGTPMIIQDQWTGVVIAYPLPPQPSDLPRVKWFEMFALLGALAYDVDRLKEENVQLSPQDPVSGVLKREAFLEMADREFRRSWRYNHSISVIILDVDGMSVINAKHGREFGNVLLREVANVCRDTVRAIDLVGRYDEDSIALLLLMTGRDGAQIVAERLRANVNRIRLASSQGAVQVSGTLGVCTYPRKNCASVFDLLALAQEAQRTARRIGPNQVVYG